jgi:hypothetical protein
VSPVEVGDVGRERAEYSIDSAYLVGHTGEVRFVLWMDGWQMQCCGDPFEVGSKISWTLGNMTGHAGLASTVGPDAAGRITHVEEHHGRLPDDLPPTEGKVRAITSAFCRYAPDAGHGRDKAHCPVPGSWVLQKVQKANGWEEEPSGLRFNGYIVELDVD